MSLTLMSPKGTPRQSTHAMAPRLSSFSGLRIALLSNGKLNADALLEETAACFTREYQCVVSQFSSKPHSGRPAENEQLQQLAANADFLITANGD